jgi:VIT1/CCC1 family predicted Fe2+/Mn2+ transporter
MILLRTLMMGGIDGIITIFNIISGIEGTNLNYKYIFILGFATLIGDAISMGTGEYLSVKAEAKYKEKENINPIKNGTIMFLSFVAFGLIPLLIYFFIILLKVKNRYISTYISIIIALFILGVIKSKYTKEKWYISGGTTSLYGASASFVVYNISKFISNL